MCYLLIIRTYQHYLKAALMLNLLTFKETANHRRNAATTTKKAFPMREGFFQTNLT